MTRTRRPAGQRAKPVQATLECALNDATSEINCLREEIGEWQSNMESNNMEHMPKYEEVSECFGYLETADDALQGLDIPEFLMDAEVHYTLDTRQSAGSRAGRLGNAMNAYYAVKSAVEDWLENNPELDATDEADDEIEPEDHITQDEADERVDQRGAAEEFLRELEEQESELDNVSFPGMY